MMTMPVQELVVELVAALVQLQRRRMTLTVTLGRQLQVLQQPRARKAKCQRKYVVLFVSSCSRHMHARTHEHFLTQAQERA